MGEAGPQQIGPFAIIRLLSEGSTGRTYLGRDERRRKRYVIVKVFSISLATSEAKGAFLSHAKRLKKLKRSNIAEILDFGIISDSGSEQEPGYHVIEYIEGSTILRQFAPGKRYTPNEIKPFLSTIADTLQYAHVSHILHGNLHPGNILLGEDIRLTDFSPIPQELLQSLEREMTPALPYKAPEHLRGRLIAASDQYSLAVMVYEWLCGHRPYAATECEALLYQQEHEPLPSPCRLNNKISPTVEAVLLKALSPDPEGRFEHMLKFSDAYLRALMGFPMSESKEKKHVELSSNLPPLTTKAMSDKKNQEETSYDKIRDEGAIHQIPTRENIHKGDIVPTFGTGTLLNKKYRIDVLVGKGGYGAVYKALDMTLDREVAIKQMLQDDLSPQQIIEATEAFKNEALRLAKLKHPSIPHIYEHFTDSKGAYIVMDYIDGETLVSYLKTKTEKHLNIKEVLFIGMQLCAVLGYLHTHELIFRDLKPSNIMRTLDGRIYLIDFGIARHFKPGKARDTSPLGTQGYASPEQFGEAQTTPKSDMYSLGATLHRLLSGNDPNQTPFMLAPLQLGNHPALVRFETLITQMLNRDTNLRPESMATIQKELESIANQWSVYPNSSPNRDFDVNQPPPIPGQLIIRPNGDAVNNAPTEEIKSHASRKDKNTSRANEPIKPKVSKPEDHSRLHKVVATDLSHGGILSERLDGYEERPAQIEMATLVAQSITEGGHAIIEASTGTGKALDVDTPIPTPTGWKQMGALVKGDFVFDEQGHPTRVLEAFEVMYHHTCYEVVFSDGSSIVADAEHEWASYTNADRSWTNRPRTSAYAAKNFVTSDQLAMLDRLIALSQNDKALSIDEATALIGGHHWSVYQAAGKIAPVNSEKRPVRYPRRTLLTAVRGRLARDLSEQRRDGRAYTLVTTERMAATLKVGSPARANHAVSVAGPLVLPDVDLPLAPYFLGIWLGDGTCHTNQITTADPALITEIESDGYTVRSLKSHPYLYAVDDENGKAVNRWQPGMTGRLRALGLHLNKHIPAIYLRASEQQRRALLAGLLDTDGTVNRHGAVEFTTTNPRLAQDMYELVCSLGFRPSLRCGRSRYKGKDCGPKWTLAFTTDEQVFRLERKATAHKVRLRNYSPERNRFRYVVAIREVPSRPVRCIRVESKSNLYLAGKSMIPTHNSLAYLLPIVRSCKVAIISTANKALQEQLFYKDIPFVQEHIQDFEAALVKGMGNYICLDRMERERIETQPFLKNPDFNRLLNIVKEFELNISGDFETLGFTLPNDIRIRVNADRDQCAWRDCSFFSRCYVRQMREKAAQSQIIVVNHTLLLLDAVLEGYLLPERDVIVVDEAHHLEEEATRAFTVTVSEPQLSALLAQHRLKEHSQADLQEEAKQTMAFAWERLAQIANPAYYKGRINLQEPLQEGLRLASVISKLADSLRMQRPENMTEQETILYDKLITRTQNLAEDVRKVFSVDQRDRFVYYVEHVVKPGRRGSQLEVSAAPLDVSIWLKEHLFNRSNVICTSATLATVGPNPVDPGDRGPNFAYFRSRVGLDYVEYPDVQERILPLTFDYERNAMLYLPRHLPEPVYGPESTGYTKAIAEEMMRLVEASRGRAFLLFSSKRMLDAVYNIFLDRLPTHLDFPLLRQGELNRIELVRLFRESKGAVLFGLKSFWEGVDIAGEALSLVVIDKMPFDPPDDPVHEARVARMKASGENWFGHYVLPQAVLRLKQGLGRLLRTHDDRGVMAILDTRLHTKGYGKLVINALPPACKTVNLRDIERFFEEEENAPF